MMSFLKIWANYNNDVPLLKILTVQTALCLVYLLSQRSAVSKPRHCPSRQPAYPYPTPAPSPRFLERHSGRPPARARGATC